MIYISFILLILDRVFKTLLKNDVLNNFGIKDFIFLEYYENVNIAFSIKFNIILTILISIVTIFLVFFIIFYIKKNQNIKIKDNPLMLILIGAFSNLFDRIFYGYVIDYVNILNINVFNLADFLIVLGTILFFLKFYVIKDKNYSNR